MSGRISSLALLSVVSLIIAGGAGISAGYTPGPSMSQLGNKHNLSSGNTAVNYRAIDNYDPRARQICIFCHTPHNARISEVLWNRREPTRVFGHYSSSSLVIDDPDVRSLSQYGEPNGSSRLCLSCHDGETALGAIYNDKSAFGTNPIQFPAAYSKISMLNLSSHHPVSFVYDEAVLLKIQTKKPTDDYKLPAQPSPVKLDHLRRMQCTTCHDPHQDWSDRSDGIFPDPGFWVAPTYQEVCLKCHNLTTFP